MTLRLGSGLYAVEPNVKISEHGMAGNYCLSFQFHEVQIMITPTLVVLLESSEIIYASNTIDGRFVFSPLWLV